jgi:Copper binding proteins, plastocyanin/azurin family
VHVDISALCFNPTVLRVRPGTTVDWVNRDGLEHTVTATGDAFDSTLQDGQGFRRRFDASGVFPYYCRIHPGMVGVVLVGDGRPSAPVVTGVAGVAAGSAPPAAGRGHHSGWLDLTIGGLIIAAAMVSLGAWRSLQSGRPTAATPN